MAATKDFLTPDEEKEIVNAIAVAEKNTSGEIRVHIENHTEKPPLERAQEVFQLLGMDNTVARNGVLFYVGVADKTFAIVGDEGIDKVVEDDFWDCTKDAVISQFKNAKFKDGLVEGILRAGERLKKYFPYDNKGDTNELPDEISKS
ncbi:TPM domain-containing protein [Flavobacterium salilacus subsp. salilacus]|uniref:TPM domain-containing protein n=1 Tax=Flavobacterium TaxID=237 RepID=UPI001074EF87|nr:MULTISPECIES: TPM domain-containing protein [Flavobacterium]KAF2519595.1 TPM domain-containing protein [Flavobacterium salilacus subsp. salilacus]MBE1614503.1 TPM domain-containing protein [Flavobacterium sp. SaA2.13]NDI98436.1 TPM domain-containing protein [Flavobacterium salilacus subsp. altitudinum]